MNPDRGAAQVWVTRDESEEGPLSSALRAAGLSPVLEPVIQIVDAGEATAIRSAIESAEWVVLTSAAALPRLPIDALRKCRIAVVGPATQRACTDLGLGVAFTSADGTAKSLWPEVHERTRGASIVYPCSARAEIPELPQSNFKSVVVYDAKDRPIDDSKLAGVAGVALASPSAVTAAASRLKAGIHVIGSIGPTTTEALRSEGIAAYVQAESPTFEALAEALATALRGKA